LDASRPNRDPEEPMSPFPTDRYQRIDAVFEAVLDLPTDEQMAYLTRTAGDDPELQEEVLRLLRAHHRSEGFLDAPAYQVAKPLLEATDLAQAGDVPDRIGPWRIVRLIGEGGMGAVFLGERADGQFEQRAAIKLIQGGTPGLIRRFIEERRILALLEHPGIARLIEGGLTPGGLPYFAMELIEGVHLHRYCEDHDLSVDRRLELLVEVCDAVSYAHQHLIIHRDLKPSNILVTPAGRVKLLDFGIAKLLSAETQADHTDTRLPVMTPQFAAPEQVRGEAVSTATDVYALGVLLYLLLTHQYPYDVRDKRMAELTRIICEQEPPKPSARARESRRRLRGDLDLIVLTALRKDPTRRYQSPTALAEDLRRFREGRPILARPDSLAYRTRKFIRRNHAALALAAATAVALVGAILVAAVVLGGAFAAGRLPGTRMEAGGPRTSIAVLPFRNLGEDSSYAYFADGLHDELLTQLAKVASLRVIGRASVRGYEETAKPLRQIGEELAVGSIVEAGVQVVGNRLRVTVRLLDPGTQTHLWAERYDRTLDDAFAVQSDIAQRIVAAVGGTLTSAEAGAIAAVPTQHAGAYDFYLQGLEYQRRAGFLRENLVTAQQLYERALALDSGFALAHSALASVHVTMHMYGYDRSPTRLELAQREAEVALGLEPGLPQAHLAAGVRDYLGFRHREALDQLDLGLRGAPNDPELWVWTAFLRRSLGQWDSAIAALEHARRLDPRDANLSHVIGDTYHYLHRYPEAIEAYRHAAALAPDLVQPRLSLAWSYVLWKGELDTLRAILRGLPLDGDPGEGGSSYGEQRLVLLLWERRPDSLLSLLRVMRSAAGTNDQTAARALFDQTPSRALFAAEAHTLRGDTGAARVAFDSAAALLTIEERAHPDDWFVHAARGMALAALGRRSEALREVRWLERFDVDHPDRYESGPAYCRARILARLGETDAALALIEQQLGGPSLLSAHELRLNPDFDPIRSDPRYQTLLRKYADPGI
jgi:eukaryotic-like serine/threonine-protein kinase